MFGWGRDACLSALFVMDFIAGERPTAFKRWTRSPEVEPHSVPAADGAPAIDMDVYRPTGVGDPLPALIVTHGFAHEGRRDPRLQALCRRLCRAGVVVVAPDFAQMRRYQLGFDDVLAFERATLAVAGLPFVDPTRIGVVGFSFAAAPVLIALARPKIRSEVRFALIFGGYFDLRRTLKYVLTGAYEYGEHRGRAALSAAGRDDRFKFLHGNVSLLPPESSRPRFVDLLQTKVRDPEADVTASLRLCAPCEQAAFALVHNDRPERFDDLYGAVAEYFDDWVQTLSPCRYSDRIATQLLIAHSLTDPKTSYVESLDLSRNVPNAPAPYLALLDTFDHVDLKLDLSSVRTLRTKVLPGLSSLFGLSRRMLAQLR